MGKSVLNLLSAATILLMGCFALASSQIQCYSCNSAQDNNAACLDPFNQSSSYVSKVNCTSGFICAKVMYYYRNQTVISRNCDRLYAAGGTCSYINSTMPVGVNRFQCSTCSSNLCNSGTTVTASILSLIFGVLFKALS